MMMTLSSGRCARTSRSSCWPRMPGRTRSVMTRSASSCAASAASAPSAVAKVVTSYPASATTSPRYCRSSPSSSTMMVCSPVARGDASRWAACSLMPSPVPCCSRRLLRRRCGERHAEDGAAHAVTLAIECLDAATMLLDNAARHGEAEAGTGLGRLRRDEGIEDDLQHVLLYAARVVLDIDDDTACGARRDVEPELRAIA